MSVSVSVFRAIDHHNRCAWRAAAHAVRVRIGAVQLHICRYNIAHLLETVLCFPCGKACMRDLDSVPKKFSFPEIYHQEWQCSL